MREEEKKKTDEREKRKRKYKTKQNNGMTGFAVAGSTLIRYSPSLCPVMLLYIGYIYLYIIALS